MRRLKLAIYHVSRALGLFALASRLHRDKLLILCYHGFQVDDEARFRPQLFIGRDTFARRLALLDRSNATVLPLGDALDRLCRSSLPRRAVAITIDDSFASVESVAMPLLKRHSFPATVYVTTYYVEKGNPIYRLAIQYLFWRTELLEIDLRGFPWCRADRGDLTDDKEREQLVQRFIAYGEKQCSEGERLQILSELADLLRIPMEEILDSRKLSLTSAAELCRLQANGIDVQLHTHRHTFPGDDSERAKDEVLENREALDRIQSGRYIHFCYPSGQWHKGQWAWLRDVGVESATTCDPGLNDATTPRYALKRFLDGENISDIEFLAELSGFAESLRQLRSWGAKPFRS